VTTDETQEPEYESIRRVGGDTGARPEEDEPEYESIRRPGGQEEPDESSGRDERPDG
jgi:hypothetical protein